MKAKEVVVGTKVKALVTFCGMPSIPKGTKGIIDEEYVDGLGFMVAWDVKGKRLPKDYREYNGTPDILRDGFDKETELKFLAVI